MAALAAVCGLLIIGFGLLLTGRAPSPAELAVEVSAFVGGIVLFFQAVILSRLRRLERQLQAALAAAMLRPGSGERDD